jgi:hypothetical protein
LRTDAYTVADFYVSLGLAANPDGGPDDFVADAAGIL